MTGKGPDRAALLAALNAAMRKASAQGVLYSAIVAERLGLSSSDLECLDFVVLSGPATAGKLAEATGLTSGAITGVIDRLERAGFARRERDPDDRRKVLVRALPAIERRIGPLYLPMMRASAAALAPYSERELDLLLGFFERAHRAALAATSELRDAGAVATLAARRRAARRAD